MHSASGRLAGLGEEAPRSNQSRWSPRVRGDIRRGSEGDLRALLPVMAPDAVLCTDGFVTYERIPDDERIPHFHAERRSTDKVHPAQPPYQYGEPPACPT
jgi:hypothetical protein